MSKILKVVGASWLQTKISSYILGLLGILAILALFVGQMERTQEDGTYSATVFYTDKAGYRIEYWGQSNELAEVPKGVARAYFRRDIDTTGWYILEVETDGAYRDDIQAYAAGIVEGALTWYLIHTHLGNTIRAKCGDQKLEKQCGKLRDALDKSVNKWKAHAAERENTDPFWHHVSLHYTQMSGIITGWKHGIDRSQNEFEADHSDLYWLNSIAEVTEIQHKLNISIEDAVVETLPGLSSAFLKIVNETSDDGASVKRLYVAQNAAGSYSSMTRILKRYKFNYHLTASQKSAPAPGVAVEFSGYPGAVTSQDEFYLLRGDRHRMAVTGTALRNYNAKLWREVNIFEQVPAAPRISAANRLSSDVTSWAHLLATNNSGTACKQWLVVDFNRLQQQHSRHSAKDPVRNDVVTEINVINDVKHTVVHRAHSGHPTGLLWLVEQVPGLTHARDLSAALLAQGYWATYGLPFIKDIAEITHVDKMEQLYGNIFSGSDSPRAVMFKRGYKNATSLESIIRLMRQNNVTAMNRAGNETGPCEDQVDCIIREGSWTGLGVRGDIVNHYREPFGVIDTKVVSGTSNSTSLEFIAISGPPYTEVIPSNSTKPAVNKGTVATTYTDQFDDQPTINGLEIRNLVKQQQVKAEHDALEILNRDVVKPFQWSDSEFSSNAHQCLPDKWAFGPFKPKWSW